MRSSLGFNRGLQAGPHNSVVHGGVTFLSLMRCNLSFDRGLQASLMSFVCSLMCSLVGLMRGLQASPLNSVIRGGNLPNGHLPADIECGHRASLVHMSDTHIFFNLSAGLGINGGAILSRGAPFFPINCTFGDGYGPAFVLKYERAPGLSFWSALFGLDRGAMGLHFHTALWLILCSTLLLPNFVINGRAIGRGLSAFLQTLRQTFLGLMGGLSGLFRGNLRMDFILNVVDLFDNALLKRKLGGLFRCIRCPILIMSEGHGDHQGQ